MTDNNQLIVNQCKNCSADISGYSYCPACGQKSDIHVFTFRELLVEIADGLFNTDSRIWRTLIPLALKPGKLTLEYLRGRRMFYLPPFRLYLILSVLFFLLPSNEGTVGDNSGQGANAELAALDTESITNPGADSNAGTAGAELARQIQEIQVEVARELAAENGANPEAYRDTGGECSLNGLSRDSLFTIVLRDACLKFMNDPERLTQEVIDMVPVMMIVGMPLVALFMFMVYALSGRYYVEHIIFLLHTHAFYFLVSIVMALSSTLGRRYDFLFGVMDWFRIIVAWYIPVYIFMAMLRVYGDGKVKTFFKGCFVMTGYGISIIIVTGFGILFTAINS